MNHKKAAALTTFAVCLSLAAGCAKKEGGGPAGSKKGQGPLQFPVETLTLTPQNVEYSLSAVGSVEAFEKVQVTARVGGVIERVLFREGDRVPQDKVLVEIEPERYKLAVDAARASLQRSEATLREANASLARREAVVVKSPGLIPGEEIESWRTRVSTANADLLQMKSSLAQAELNLRDAFVRAPVSGTIQTRTVQTGQYVQPGTVLASLVRRDPLLLRFQIAERDAGRLGSNSKVSFRVAGEEKSFSAHIVNIAEAADAVSRMVLVTATVDDPDKESVRPGAFADVTVPIGGVRGAIVIPQTAIRASEKGFLAYTVSADKAQERVVELGLRTPDGRVEVRKGLSASEVLVVRGAEALRDGAPVKIAEVAPSVKEVPK